MTHAILVASEIRQAGFRTKVFTKSSVLVSLTNRPVGEMEVWKAIDNSDLPEEIFDIEFTTDDKVLVSW